MFLSDETILQILGATLVCLLVAWLHDRYSFTDEDFDMSDSNVILKVIMMKSVVLVGLNEARKLIPKCETGQRIYLKVIDDEMVIISDRQFKAMCEVKGQHYRIEYLPTRDPVKEIVTQSHMD